MFSRAVDHEVVNLLYCQPFSGVHVAQSLLFSVVFYRSLFVLYLLAIVLYVLLAQARCTRYNIML
jgi:hypothetical protein